mgnify:CR=1 FL=1
MLAKRIIPCLDIKDGRTVKGVNFENLRDAGDPVELAKLYAAEGADELVFLDITASSDGRDTIIDVVYRTAEEVFIPFTVGGGIRELSDARALLRAGADKISVNTSAVQRPQVIADIADEFGSQCVVCAIDAKWDAATHQWMVFLHGGRTATELNAVEWAVAAVSLGAGEILLTSMDRDGTRDGFDLGLTRAVSDAVGVPVIASGGLSNNQDIEALCEAEAEGVMGVIAGRSIYAGDLDLAAAQKYADELTLKYKKKIL